MDLTHQTWINIMDPTHQSVQRTLNLLISPCLPKGTLHCFNGKPLKYVIFIEINGKALDRTAVLIVLIVTKKPKTY